MISLYWVPGVSVFPYILKTYWSEEDPVLPINKPFGIPVESDVWDNIYRDVIFALGLNHKAILNENAFVLSTISFSDGPVSLLNIDIVEPPLM